MLSCTLEFPLPPTLNEQINLARTHWSKSAKIKKNWTNKIAAIALQQQAPAFPGKVWINFTWYVTLASDQDNVAAAAKYLCDGLVTAGVLKKDNLTIIQSPVLHCYEKRSQKTPGKVIVNIDESPLTLINKINDFKNFHTIEQC